MPVKYKSSPQSDVATLFHDSRLAFYTCDRNGYITYYNKAAAALWGREPVIGEELWCGSWKIYYPGGRVMPLDECPMALTLKQQPLPADNEIVIERPDSTFLNLLVYPQPLFDANGLLTGALNILVDITPKKTGEEKQAILSAIVESSDDAIISKSLKGIIMSWNKGAQKLFGYTEDEIIGKPITVLIPPELQEEETVIIGNIKAGNKIDHFRTTRITKWGKKVKISLTVSPVKDNMGRIIGASKIARDITEQLQKEEAIKLNSQRLELLNAIGKKVSASLDEDSILELITTDTANITGAAVGAFVYNMLDEHGQANQLTAVFGAPKEALENSGLFTPEFLNSTLIRVDDITKDSRYGKKAPQEVGGNGQPVITSYLAVPVETVSGEILGGLFFGHPEPGKFTAEHENIVSSIASQASVALNNCRLFTQVKNLSEKKDEFIALASHELKTPITSIKGYLQILQRSDLDKAGTLFLEKSLNQINKLNSLIGDLLDVSKVEAGKLTIQYESFDLKELVLDVIETFHYSSKTHKITFSSSADQIFVEADKQRIEQVLINLLSNAIKYSPNAELVVVELNASENEAKLSVKDKGIGLSEQHQKNIFTRFYRADGNENISGLGLGLYLSKEIILHHRGTIDVISEPGKGSTFYFSLPVKHQV
jgi:PAS domain S-box-containing protein